MVKVTKKVLKKKKPVKKTTKKKTAPESLEKIDVVFVIDATGSMGPYIAEAKKYAAHIINDIMSKGQLDIQVALITYRDHPPQDFSYVANVYDFGTVEKFHQNLYPIDAQGGGDRPEAVWDGVNELFKLTWRDKSDRIVYLVGDSPAHRQCPCGLQPDYLIEKLKEFNIELNAHSIAGFEDTTADFKLLVDATGGQISVGSKAQDTTKLYSDSLSYHSYLVDNARVFTANASTVTGGTYNCAADITLDTAKEIGKEAGLTEEESVDTFNYLNKRGL